MLTMVSITITIHLIFIFTFMNLARFYPKRLTLFRLYIYIVSMCIPWESNPQPLHCQRNALTTEPQEHIHLHKASIFVHAHVDYCNKNLRSINLRYI